ncbi:MAG TPA: CBS domain-containing protein [Tepidisphaeraceae bacterium]|nr:CBS domain-containing protein [Tepidisphaeraceae bacterium]
MPVVRDVLSNKGRTVHTVDADASVLEATQMMNRHRIGAVVVMHDDRLVGVFTERDVLTRVVGFGGDLRDLRVRDVMTRDVITAHPDTDLAEVSEIMAEKRIRHLPICEQDGRLCGMISIGDVNAAFAAERETHLHYLQDYVYGRA